MIAPEIVALITSPTMIIVSTADRANRASIGRSTGASFRAETGSLCLFVSAKQWPSVFIDLEATSPIAATFVVPQSYRTVQIKGRVQSAGPADAEDLKAAQHYRGSMRAVMDETGVSMAQWSHTMAIQALQTIVLQPTDVFNQTPGPQAGSRLRVGSPL